MDHDQRFEAMIRVFFEDFLRLFFRTWAERFDFSTLEWLDKEVYPNPPEGSRHVLDLVARIRCKQPIEPSPVAAADEMIAAVLVEIESRDSATRLKPRLPEYYLHLRSTYDIPVLPIVLYLKVGLDGIGVDVHEERFGELTPLRFEYLYVGLPALNAIEYLETGSDLAAALTALMKVARDRIAYLAAEAMKRIAGSSSRTDQERFLLAECFQAYAPEMDEPTRAEYEKLLQGSDRDKVIAMNKTSYDEGIEKGREALVRLCRQMLSDRFGAVPPSVAQQLEKLPLDHLEKVAGQIYRVESVEALPLN
jgi:hypothetical protein